jgi:hypothetical protein
MKPPYFFGVDVAIAALHRGTTRLRIRNLNGLDDIRKLAEALETYSSVSILDLCGNNIDDAGVASLMRSFEKCTKLISLDLSNNPIREVGIRMLVETLPFLPPTCNFWISTCGETTDRVWNQAKQAPDRRAFYAFFAASYPLGGLSQPPPSPAVRFSKQDGDNAINRRVLNWLVIL